jgi:hypothetical protein
MWFGSSGSFVVLLLVPTFAQISNTELGVPSKRQKHGNHKTSHKVLSTSSFASQTAEDSKIASNSLASNILSAVMTKKYKTSSFALRTAENTKSGQNSSKHQTQLQKGEVLCTVASPGSSIGDRVSVSLLGDLRFLSFGVDPDTWQSTVRCKEKKGAAPCQKHDGIVTDAKQCTPCPCEWISDEETTFPSTALLRDKVVPVCEKARVDRPVDILLIGLGGGVLQSSILEKCPKGTRVRAIEADPRVAGLAELYFGLKLSEGSSEVQVADGLTAVKAMALGLQSSALQTRREFLNGTSSGHTHSMGAEGWDAVLVDCFSDTEIPEHCKSPDFIGAMRSILKRDGIALQHVFHTWEAYPERQLAEYKQIKRTYLQTFGASKVRVTKVPPEEGYDSQDDVISAAKG